MTVPIQFRQTASAAGTIFRAQYGSYTIDMDGAKTSLTIMGENEFEFFSISGTGEIAVISGDNVTRHWNAEDWNSLKSAIAAAK